MISDVPLIDPSRWFDHAEQGFVHGNLEVSQRDAEFGYRRFIYSNPILARKFQLLEATVMAWRGLNEDALRSLADDRIPWVDRDDQIQRSAIQSVAFTYLHRLGEANQALVEADRLCVAGDSNQCGAVLRAHGIFSLERGQTASAKDFFLATLKFARSRSDRLLEATALFNLGHTASQQEHHEEATSFYESSAQKAMELGANDLLQSALGNEGWQQYSLGNPEKALEVFNEAERRAAELGDISDQVAWLTTAALAYADMGQIRLAENTDLHAIDLARKINKKEGIIDASMDLAQVYIRESRANEADRYASDAWSMAQQTGSQIDMLNSHLLSGEVAALRHDWPRAQQLLHEVIASSDSQTSMKWDAEHALGNMYEAQGQMAAAEDSYKSALVLVEGARSDLEQEVSQLTFLANATNIYDDYIHLLVQQGRSDEALQAADWSRARTLQQGLGLISSAHTVTPPAFHASEIARKSNSTLLFYWLGEKQSYLWAIAPAKTTLIALPAKRDLIPQVDRYRRALLALKDPLRSGDKDGRALYETLVAPAASMIQLDRPVVLFIDGEMGQLNFETLVSGSPTPHYWIEDATVLSAPSIRLFAAGSSRIQNAAPHRLLLFGDSLSPGDEFPPLPNAALEVEMIKRDFPASDVSIFQGPRATPAAYLANKPEQYAYIHFVTHGTASRTDPLESAVILSRANSGTDSYKLYAREILRHPIEARLVTISACNSSGTKSYAGEGLVGLSWAFMRAGAHNAIGTLWEVTDSSTPELMAQMYGELEQGKQPATALRDAKLNLIHSNGNFSRPFYWAPFQLYAGR